MVREPTRLAVVGVGGIGNLHADKIASSPSTRLVAVSGLSADAGATATRHGVPNRVDYRDVLVDRPQGVVIALPNQLHVEAGKFFAESGVHLLVEKPIADTVSAGVALVEAAATSGVKLLVGHHRRHNALIPAARAIVRERLGVLLATNTLNAIRKPDDYYDVSWRTEVGAGPLLVNTIHEIDILRAICGEIDAVQAVGHNVRGFVFDDTHAINLQYHSGAVGTLLTVDPTPSPWSWEASVAEGMGFRTYDMIHSVFFGTEGSVSLPDLRFWHYAGGERPGWHSELTSERIEVRPNDPYRDQIEHFARVITDDEPPLVDGADALRSLAVAEAIAQATRHRSKVTPASVLTAAADPGIHLPARKR